MRVKPLRIDQRIRRLEARLSPGRITLYFEDSSAKQIHGQRGFLLKLFPGLNGGDLSPVQAKQLDLIRQSTSAQEPGGAHLCDLLRALLPEPTETRHQRAACSRLREDYPAGEG